MGEGGCVPGTRKETRKEKKNPTTRGDDERDRGDGHSSVTGKEKKRGGRQGGTTTINVGKEKKKKGPRNVWIWEGKAKRPTFFRNRPSKSLR